MTIGLFSFQLQENILTTEQHVFHFFSRHMFLAYRFACIIQCTKSNRNLIFKHNQALWTALGAGPNIGLISTRIISTQRSRLWPSGSP